jgi:hypothetical protein
MNRKYALLVILSALLLSSIPAVVVAQTVGVKAGQWAEYNVTITGTPEAGHDATWARMEIDTTGNAMVNLTFLSRLTNGTTGSIKEDINFATGNYIDYFVVPAEAKVGDAFHDQTFNSTATVTGTETKTYVGTQRTVLSGSTVETRYYWDQATGALVEAYSTYPTFTVHTVIDKTNLWSAQSTILGLSPVAFFGIVFVVLVIALAIVVALVRARKART